MNMLNVGKWDELFTKTKNYMMQENGKFSPFKIKEGKKKSILATALGVELMVTIAEKDETLKEQVMPLLQKSALSHRLV